jgi:hypothetical protein
MISDDVGQIWPILNCIVLTDHFDRLVYTTRFKFGWERPSHSIYRAVVLVKLRIFLRDIALGLRGLGVFRS